MSSFLTIGKIARISILFFRDLSSVCLSGLSSFLYFFVSLQLPSSSTSPINNASTLSVRPSCSPARYKSLPHTLLLRVQTRATQAPPASPDLAHAAKTTTTQSRESFEVIRPKTPGRPDRAPFSASTDLDSSVHFEFVLSPFQVRFAVRARAVACGRVAVSPRGWRRPCMRPCVPARRRTHGWSCIGVGHVLLWSDRTARRSSTLAAPALGARGRERRGAPRDGVPRPRPTGLLC